MLAGKKQTHRVDQQQVQGIKEIKEIFGAASQEAAFSIVKKAKQKGGKTIAFQIQGCRQKTPAEEGSKDPALAEAIKEDD